MDRTGKIFLAVIIVVLGCFVFIIGSVIYVAIKMDAFAPIGSEYIEAQDWAVQFEDIPPPQDTIVLAEGYGDNVDKQDDYLDYAYGWLLKSDLTKDELEAYYQPYVDRSNEDVIGSMAVIRFEVIWEHNLDAKFDIPPIVEAVAELEDISDENEYYIIYVFKRGRWGNRN